MILVKKIITLTCLSLILCMAISIPSAVLAEDYSFDLDEFEKKSFTWGGYAELRWDHNSINRDSAFALLGFYGNPRSKLDRLASTLQLDGNYNKGIVDFNWLLQTSAQKTQVDSEQTLDIFSAYASIKPTPAITFELGKKTYKWGKGYAWNPVGFINRPKDPNNPEEALEGFIGVGVDLIKSFSGNLQTIALTGVVLPVWDNFNDDFGEQDHINLAAKLYLLYLDTDIDFIFYTGDSRSTRYGIDFSKNLATNFEIHGEVAHIPKHKTKTLNSIGSIETETTATTSYLIGLRYLTTNDITTILEFYHNDTGYSETEMEQFYQLVNNASDLYNSTGDVSLLNRATTISKAGYARPQAGQNYIYAKVSQKEPFDLLYFTPGIATIYNLDDNSYSLSPEAIYTGITNLEVRLRYSYLAGGRFTEHGEKLNEQKLELRIRYYF